MTVPADEPDLVFNIVWTGEVFTYLNLFVASQLHHSSARYRFVANGCPPAQIELMEKFSARWPDRVVEVLDVSPDDMVAHGVALDRVRAQRHDGDHFCLIDPDIKANGPFVGEFVRLLRDHAAVTSGTEVWSESNVIPENHPGVPGEFFFDRHGFVFGSPHLALYRRDALDETAERWGVGLGSAGPELPDATKARLAEMGHEYLVYDTGKIVNALIQGDGHRLVHRDLTQLVHIGGLAHYLWPSHTRINEAGEEERDRQMVKLVPARYELSRFSALTLRELSEGRDPPVVPAGLPEATAERLEVVRREIVDLVATYGSV